MCRTRTCDIDHVKARLVKECPTFDQIIDWAIKQCMPEVMRSIRLKEEDAVSMNCSQTLVTDHILTNSCFGGNLIFLLRSSRGAEYCDQSLCLCVCVSSSISLAPLDRSSRNYLCRSSVAVARSSSGDVAICYVLPVVWMTSRLAVMGRTAMRGKLNL